MTHFQLYSSVPAGRKGLFVNIVRAWEWWWGNCPLACWLEERGPS